VTDVTSLELKSTIQELSLFSASILGNKHLHELNVAIVKAHLSFDEKLMWYQLVAL